MIKLDLTGLSEVKMELTYSQSGTIKRYYIVAFFVYVTQIQIQREYCEERHSD